VKIYALRDKLIDYYMTPFAAQTDKDVLGGIANAVNNQEENSAISKAPHHFEIWCIGHVTEAGEIVPDKYLIADASSLVRPTGQEKRDHKVGGPLNGSQRPIERASETAGTQPAPSENPP